MRFSKASKKSSIAEGTGSSVPEISAAAESTGNPRTSRPSKPKKETGETGPAKHRKAASEPLAESSPAPKTFAAAANGSSSDSPVIDAVGVVAPVDANQQIATRSTEISPSHEEIANQAYALWAARGYAPGSPEEDWLRAEQQLKSAR